MKTYRALKVLLCIMGFICVERLCHLATDGFSSLRIKPYTEVDERFNPSKPSAKVCQDLNQPFRYLSSGSQSFAFISDDGQFVLKFFKIRPGVYAQHKYRKRLKSFDRACQSCLINKKHFKAESGMLYCHLAPSNHALPAVKLHGPAGSVVVQELKDVPFILQKHAETIEKRLLRLKSLGDRRAKEKTIDCLLELMVKRFRLGFSDKDPNWMLNFGFIDDRVACIDVGGLIDNRAHLTDYFLGYELDKAAKRTISWLDKHNPELIPYVEKKVADIKGQIR